MTDPIGLTDATALPADWIAIGEHPQFAAATRSLAGSLLRIGDEDRRLSAVFKDAGRYIAAIRQLLAIQAACLHALTRGAG